MDITTGIIALVIGLAIGFAIARILEKGRATRTIEGAKKEAASILKDARAEGENIKKEKIYQAKEKFLELKAEHEKVIIKKDTKMRLEKGCSLHFSSFFSCFFFSFFSSSSFTSSSSSSSAFLHFLLYSMFFCFLLLLPLAGL